MIWQRAGQMDNIRIYDVTARDGLQNEKEIVSTADKRRLIQKIIEAGNKDIEITSFVKPSWIPQLADNATLVRILPPAPEGVRYWALIPNQRGLDSAIDCGIQHIATFMSASATHNRKNLNRTQKESISNIKSVIESAKSEDMTVRAYISTVFGCPYEGSVDPTVVLSLTQSLLALGADEIALGDTTGMANPQQVRDVIALLVEEGIPVSQLALHLHDTRGTALANAYAGYLSGIRTFDGSAAGLGGCPYAPGASGNAATEDIIQLFHSMGLQTGVDLEKAASVGLFLEQLLGRELPGRYYKCYKGSIQRSQNTA